MVNGNKMGHSLKIRNLTVGKEKEEMISQIMVFCYYLIMKFLLHKIKNILNQIRLTDYMVMLRLWTKGQVGIVIKNSRVRIKSQQQRKSGSSTWPETCAEQSRILTAQTLQVRFRSPWPLPPTAAHSSQGSLTTLLLSRGVQMLTCDPEASQLLHSPAGRPHPSGLVLPSCKCNWCLFSRNFFLARHSGGSQGQNMATCWVQWWMPVTSAAWQAEARESQDQVQPGQLSDLKKAGVGA